MSSRRHNQREMLQAKLESLQTTAEIVRLNVQTLDNAIAKHDQSAGEAKQHGYVHLQEHEEDMAVKKRSERKEEAEKLRTYIRKTAEVRQEIKALGI